MTKRRSAPFVIVVLTVAVTLARTLRLPNDFSEIHWLLDYRFGLMKRGFVGSLCSLVGDLFGFRLNPGLIIALSAVIFALFCIVLLIGLYRLLDRHHFEDNTLLAVLVFAGSPFLVMSAHLFGYFDALLYLLTIAAVTLTLKGRPFAGAAVSVIGVLTHEGYLLIGFPWVCVAAIMADNRRTRHLIAQVLPPLAFLALVIAQSFVIDQAALRAQLVAYLGSYDFIPTRIESVARWHTTGFNTLLHSQDGPFLERLLRSTILMPIAPPLLFLFYHLYSTFRLRFVSAISLLLLAAVAAPLAMHAVAWDTARISSYTLGGVMIAWWILTQSGRDAVGGTPLAWAALPVLILNIGVDLPLMDGETDRFNLWWRCLLYAPTLLLALSILLKKPVRSRRSVAHP